VSAPEGADRRVARPVVNRQTPVLRSGRPDWLKVRVRATPELEQVRRTVSERGLHTVCFSAACPNLNECWSRGTATFMIGGPRCTRRCASRPAGPTHSTARGRRGRRGGSASPSSPGARDDLPDGGASQMAATVRAIRERCPGVGIEVLIADYAGDEAALAAVLDARPETTTSRRSSACSAGCARPRATSARCSCCAGPASWRPACRSRAV
jgi:lipoic acid synthetase